MANRVQESHIERSHQLAYQNARSARNRIRRQHDLLNTAFTYFYTLYCTEQDDIDIGKMDNNATYAKLGN